MCGSEIMNGDAARAGGGSSATAELTSRRSERRWRSSRSARSTREVAVFGRASTRPPPSQRCSMPSRRVTRSASAASSSSTSEEIVCATASSSASSPPGLADVLFRELLVLVLEHVPAESLLALCETSREFGVLAREVGAARMKHAPRWAARALYGIGNPLHQLALAERAQQICDSWSDAHSEIRHCEEHGRCRQLRRASSPARRYRPRVMRGPARNALALAPSPRSPAPATSAAAARRPDAAGG